MLRFSAVRRGTLVKIGRGLENITESASNSLLESLQQHGYCYIQHPFIQKSILDQLHRDCRIFFEQYVLNIADDAQGGNSSSGHGKKGNKHNYNCSPLTEYELEGIRSPTGFRGYYRYVGASGKDDAIDCFSIGRDDTNDPAALRRDYYIQAGWEEQEYLPLINRRNPWDVLLNHVNVHPSVTAGAPPFSGLNNNFMSDFRDMMVAYYELCSIVSIDVLRHISCGLGIRPSVPQGGFDPSADYDYNFFTQYHNKKDFDLQAKYYPKVGNVTRVSQGVGIQNVQSPHNPSGVRVLRRKGATATPLMSEGEEDATGQSESLVRLDTHKDLSTLTLLSQDALGGLELWDDEKKDYVAVPVLEDALLVNAGLFLEKWTGGLIEATPHRVRTRKGQNNNSRCSIVFFAMPNHDAWIEPLLQQDDNPATDGQDGFFAGDMMPSSL